jgi:UDP:flavonoid glycosyltransferase YjiC (YdhE family)
MMPNLRDMYDDLEAACEDADLVVSHPLTFAAPVLCEKRGLPWASSVLAPLSFFSKMDPPLALPGPITAAIHRKWPRALSPLNTFGLSLTRFWTNEVRDLRRTLGLPPGQNPVGLGQFSPLLTVAMFSTALATPQADWPRHTVVTGAVRYDGIHGAMSPDLHEFLDNGPPPIVFTLGSAAVATNRAAHFYEISVAAATAMGRRSVLLVGREPQNRPTVVAGEVFVTEWAPHSELFPRAAAIVHQGGAGTLHTALESGRPMLIVPFAHDQPDNAARAERLGVARVVYPEQYSAKRVSLALQALLSDPGVRENAMAVSELVGAEDGAWSAATAISQLASHIPYSS